MARQRARKPRQPSDDAAASHNEGAVFTPQTRGTGSKSSGHRQRLRFARCCHRPGGRSTLPPPPSNDPLPGSRFIFRMGRFDRRDFPPITQTRSFVVVSRSTGPANARPPLRYLPRAPSRAVILAPLSCFPVQKKQDRRRFKMKSKDKYQLRLAIIRLRRRTKKLRVALKSLKKGGDFS